MTTVSYPKGALVRVNQICSEPPREDKPGHQGLLPIHRTTWWKWIKAGKVKPGTKLSPKTVVWPVEYVLSLAGQVHD